MSEQHAIWNEVKEVACPAVVGAALARLVGIADGLEQQILALRSEITETSDTVKIENEKD